jgi:hypothetical protein
MDMMRKMTSSILGVDAIDAFHKNPGIMTGINAAISLPLFFGRRYSAGNSGTKTIKSLRSLEAIANSRKIEQKNIESITNIEDIYKMINKAPILTEGTKIKRGRLYNVDFPKIMKLHDMGGFEMPNRLALIQDPATGAMFASGRSDVHHGDLMKRVGELGFFPKATQKLDPDKYARFSYKVKGKKYYYTDWQQHTLVGKRIGDKTSKGITFHDRPGKLMFDYKSINIPGKDTRSATIGRMRLLKDLQEAGFDVGAFIRKAPRVTDKVIDDWDLAREPYRQKGIDVYRGIKMAMPSNFDFIGGKPSRELIDAAIKTNMKMDWGLGTHWSPDIEVAQAFAKPSKKQNLYGVVIHAQVLPKDIVKPGSEEYKHYSRHAGVVGPNSIEREITVREGSKLRLLKGDAYLPDGSIIKTVNIDDNLVKVKHGSLNPFDEFLKTGKVYKQFSTGKIGQGIEQIKQLTHSVIPKDTSRWEAYGNNIQMVPTNILKHYREYNRATDSAHSLEQVNKLMEDIKKHGIKEPLILEYATKDKTAYLGEGNHRLAAAIKLGIKDVPVRVYRRTEGFSHAKKPVPGIEPNKHGYVPQDMSPSDIGIHGVDWRNYTKKFSKGIAGVPGTGTGDTIKAMLTPGEWVLNKKQLRRLSQTTGQSLQQIKANVFGTKMGHPPALDSIGKGLKVSKKYYPYKGATFELIPQTDDNNIDVWFIKMADGTFGQVTGRDAEKIQSSRGKYIPNYVKRNSHGFSQRMQKAIEFRNTSGLGMNMGGVVMPGMQRFASGGIVQAPGHGNTTNTGATVHQNFNVKTEGATDWSYVMRLSAITAQSSF